MSARRLRVPRRQSGVALIMVLLAMALVVLLAAGMTHQQSVRVFRTGHYLAQQQGYSVALGAEDFARRILTRDFEDDKEDNAMVDSLDEFWAANAAILPLDDQGVVEVQVDDLSGRFNLNDLVTATGQVDTLAKERFNRLLMVLGISAIHADALVDWIDANDEPGERLWRRGRRISDGRARISGREPAICQCYRAAPDRGHDRGDLSDPEAARGGPAGSGGGRQCEHRHRAGVAGAA